MSPGADRTTDCRLWDTACLESRPRSFSGVPHQRAPGAQEMREANQHQQRQAIGDQ